jgi:hypothetical protein
VRKPEEKRKIVTLKRDLNKIGRKTVILEWILTKQGGIGWT